MMTYNRPGKVAQRASWRGLAVAQNTLGMVIMKQCGVVLMTKLVMTKRMSNDRIALSKVVFFEPDLA